MNRRQFLTTTALAAPLLAAETRGKKRRNPYCVFTKPLQMLSYDDLADLIAELGFDGIEGTIRPGGQITPEQVPDELPKMMAALKKRGLEMTIMASGINNADDKLNIQQLQVAAQLGIKRYRMGYHKYDLKKPVLNQMNELRPVLKNLVALNKELGLQAIYQNHSGSNYVGAPLWDLHELFKAHDPAHLAVGFDMSHATAARLATARQPAPAAHRRPVREGFSLDRKQTRQLPLGRGYCGPKISRAIDCQRLHGPDQSARGIPETVQQGKRAQPDRRHQARLRHT